MTEQENAKRLEAIERVLTASINRLEAGSTSAIDNHMQELFSAYDEGVKSGEANGGYRDGFAAGLASANKTIAESLASIIALREIVDQCRASGFVDTAGNVRQVLGVLPLTGDGCVVGSGAELFRTDGGGHPCPDGHAKIYVQDTTSYPESHWYLGEWYSTREMAESARRHA